MTSYQSSTTFRGFEVWYRIDDGDPANGDNGEFEITSVRHGKNRVPVDAFDSYLSNGNAWGEFMAGVE